MPCKPRIVSTALDGAPDTTAWYGPFKRSPAAAQPGVMQQAERALRLIAQQIVPALQALADTFEHELLPVARDSIACSDVPQGAALYSFWARHFTTTDTLTPQAIHALDLAEVERLQSEMAAVAAQAGYAGNLAAYRHFLAHDPQFVSPSAEALRERCEVVAKRIDAQIPAFFGRLPRITYGVQSMPAASAARLPPAYAQPSPADGSAAGVFWVSGLPEKCPS